MCGIFGYTGHAQAAPILMDGLQRLEYRGYDSAGIAVLDGERLAVRKTKGRLENLTALLETSPVSGTAGVGHTRWATHGGPSDENAHPHTDADGRFAVVHNGIIENHAELRRWLESEGYTFRSQTDTEVVAHLLARHFKGDLPQALREAIHYLRGAFALAVLCQDAPGMLCAARVDSPLVIGMSEGGQFIASDIPALLPYTREVLLLEDGEIAVVTPEGCVCYNPFGQRTAHKVETVTWEQQSADLGGYPHYMSKEIHEQPAAMRAVLAAYTQASHGKHAFGQQVIPPEQAAGLERLFLIGCGSAYHAAAVGKLLIERLARVPVETDIASEFRYRNPILRPGDLCVCISQSGETADTLAALRLATKSTGTLGIVNAVGSTLSREAGSVLYTHAGPEIAVATTKGYMTQVLSLSLLALQLALSRGQMDEAEAGRALNWLSQTPAQAEGILGNVRHIQRFASAHCDHHNVFFIGRGLDYALAMEASLKLKEITYTHSEAYAAGELKHGTIALVEPGTLVVALVTQPDLADKTFSNIVEARARGAEVLVLTTKSMGARAGEAADEVWEIPDTEPIFAPLLGIIPMQLLAYYIALARGCDVDKPRNLAKSVTVE